jgi:hypothetical protein
MKDDTTTERKPRRLLQLRLSTLLLMVAMLALAAGWWSDHLRLERKIRMLTRETVILNLNYVNSDDAVRTLRGMHQGDTDLVFGSDSRSNSVVVSGSPKAIASIKAVIERLDQ